MKLGTSARDAACDAIVDLLDGGDIEIRTGAAPADPQTAASGTLLATLTFGTPAFDDAGSSGGNSDGQATAETITSDSDADASGNAGHARLKTSGGTAVIDCSAGDSGDSPELEFDNKSIVAGGVVAISSLTITVAE